MSMITKKVRTQLTMMYVMTNLNSSPQSRSKASLKPTVQMMKLGKKAIPSQSWVILGKLGLRLVLNWSWNNGESVIEYRLGAWRASILRCRLILFGTGLAGFWWE